MPTPPSPAAEDPTTRLSRWLSILVCAALALGLSACASSTSFEEPPLTIGGGASYSGPAYRIGPGDELEISVWRSEDLSIEVPVRPDGRFSSPLIDDLPAAGRTAAELASDIQERLRPFVVDPQVSVKVVKLGNRNRQSIRVLGEVTRPAIIPYRAGLRVTDVLTAVGGVSPFADGNKTVLVREQNGQRQQYGLRLDDLVREGDVSADRPLYPGDIIIIPESLF
ncbi:MAG: XrtA/PEP-CTERM system exopolysaccharide export protein [Pseudomonadota bacterium]